MEKSIAERQRKFKDRMYEAGFMQKQVWIKRDPKKRVKMDMKSFIRRMQKLTSGWSEASISQLLSLFVRITETKKEVGRKRKDA